jgi:hypothetical protein
MAGVSIVDTFGAELGSMASAEPGTSHGPRFVEMTICW